MILLIGSLKGHMVKTAEIAVKRGFRVISLPNMEAGLEFLRQGSSVEVILYDAETIDTPSLSNALIQERFSIPLIACGLGNNHDIAVKSIEDGAEEYLPLPPDAEYIVGLLETVTQDNNKLLYKSKVMEELVRSCKNIAASEANVLITGESGTGKEVMARFIHDFSKRKSKSMISVNSAAIPDNLLESELFGHEKGSFTGALARRIGKFEEANNSTLLLDEISEMDLRLQAKLLRAIQEREITRLGSNSPIKVNIRIIATSNRDLEQSIKEGSFREDLFFRLNVLRINMPSLRDRIEDILPLANHFVEKYSKLNGLSSKSFDDEAIELMHNYNWPGNVRELENMVHRSLLMSLGNKLSMQGILKPAEGSSTDAKLVGRTVAEVEQELITQTLNHCHGNRTRAAELLGISIRTLRNKLKLYKSA